jgi:hypothetical protein
MRKENKTVFSLSLSLSPSLSLSVCVCVYNTITMLATYGYVLTYHAPRLGTSP